MASKGFPKKFRASGLSDSQTQIFPGACRYLKNLIFDRTNRGAITARAAVTSLTTFPGFTSPGVISCAYLTGTMVYGLIASGLNAGYDQPFAYDISTDTFVAITGITSTTVPKTVATSGPWTPPTMDLVGTKLVVTHPGVTGSGIMFYWFDLSTPSTPSWNAGNTTTNLLPSPPTAVCQFFERAYYVIGNVLWASDVIEATSITNASQTLTLGDTNPILGLKGLPIGTSTQGILQALLGFKAGSIWQVTGDFALSNTAVNQLSGSIGSSAPRTLVARPTGVGFMANDGIREVTPMGQVGYMNADIILPFSNASEPSRACAAYANGITRICLDTLDVSTAVRGDFWHDELFDKWNGYHTFPYDQALPYGSEFVLVSNANPGQLFLSQVVPTSSSVYTELGSQIISIFQSADDPGEQLLADKQIIETTLEILNNGLSYFFLILAYDNGTGQVGQAFLVGASTQYDWDGTTWGGGLWQSAQYSGSVVQIPWNAPLVGKRISMALQASASSALHFRDFNYRVQEIPIPEAA
ncbi:MAG: hypothetical protein ACYCOR_17865 [Acidobacteriaceae bacterium]